MGKPIGTVTLVGIWLAFAPIVRAADQTREFAVQLSASVQTDPARITLMWPPDNCLNPERYTVYRKAPDASSWGEGTILPGTATFYTDQRVAVGTPYEYQVVKTTAQYTGYGYLYAGIQAPLTEDRGKLLLVVDHTCAGPLAFELARLEQDLVGDGWTVLRTDVNRDEPVRAVKCRILSQYRADPAHVKALFLFGHVPVPYSGDIVPDGHCPDHRGAWPCDGYYGDMDGIWTDWTVNFTGSESRRNHNVPGDGKFDQSFFPAPIKLMVGRVDLANMPGRLTWQGPPTFPGEMELLRNYLNKDHAYRHKLFDLPRRACLGDFFGVRNGEAFAASGDRNFAAFFGAGNLTNITTPGAWIKTLSVTPALCAYGCGDGSFTSIAGLGNADGYHDVVTTEIVTNDVKTVFALLYGSWLGDWDSEDNILRSILACPSYGLAAAWSGRPHWFLQHLALGEPIGFAARLTQNNGPLGLYRNQMNSCAGQIHIALMGDPTLRLHPVAPPSNLLAATRHDRVTLRWTPSPEPVSGYLVYGGSDPNGPFTRRSQFLLRNTAFTDPNPTPAPIYMVRAVKLETSASGTYYNPSQGAFIGAEAGDLGGMVWNSASSVAGSRRIARTGPPVR